MSMHMCDDGAGVRLQTPRDVQDARCDVAGQAQGSVAVLAPVAVADQALGACKRYAYGMQAGTDTGNCR